MKSKELDEAIAALSAKVSGLDSQQQAVAAQVSRSAERADQTIATFQQQFANAQERRANEFEAAAQELKTLVDEEMVSLQAKVEEAGELVTAFAAAGTANAYGKEAKHQAAAADKWRIVAIALSVCAALAAVTLIFDQRPEASELSLIVGKVAVGLAFGGLAGYAARQSGRHRTREEVARHSELNIVPSAPASTVLIQISRPRLDLRWLSPSSCET